VINLRAIYLTGGALSCYELAREKSAEVIVVEATSSDKTGADSQINEGLNIEWSEIR